MDNEVTFFWQRASCMMPSTRCLEISTLGCVCYPGPAIHQRQAEVDDASLADKALAIVVGITSKDMILVGCGRDPTVAQAVQTKLKQFESINSFRWHPLVPVAQARSSTKHYIEYVLVGVGPDSPSTGSVPFFFGRQSTGTRPANYIPSTATSRSQASLQLSASSRGSVARSIHLPNLGT